MPNEISIYGKHHVPGSLAGMYASGPGEAGTNSVSTNYLCIAADMHLYVIRNRMQPPPHTRCDAM